ncbi:MAG TPA: heme biosynthesis HemY N-terminal domain-containing protein [Xanthobacteraceae bacterium]|nr:heme biosynthesis HemY N-terminal domain-containing protein [Xanthobacteraceae bacterium]
MIRVILFLLFVGVVALGFVWLADRPGEVAITWLGYRIETSFLVAIVAIALVAILTTVLWSAALFVLRTPRRMARARGERRQRQGLAAIAHGLVAVGAGDAPAARKFAGEAQRIAPSESLTLLLAAQTAQLHGDRVGAEAAFREMAERPETRLIGLRGLYIESRRRADLAAARVFAEEAAATAPSLPWAGQAVLEFRCADRDWEGALKVLDRNLKAGLLDAATWRRHRAVLMTARAMSLEDTNRDAAKGLALEAIKLAPDLVPAAALAGRLLADAGEVRKAGRILEASWRLNPHPEFAELFAHLRIADSARERLARIEALIRQTPGHVEGRLALARAALDAREFATARTTLEPLLGAPTQRVCALMAELEEVEHGDTGRAREWMARALHAARDPGWTADGFVSDRWVPVSPVTGRLDAFQWKVPVAEIPGPSRVIEEVRQVRQAPQPAIQPPAEQTEPVPIAPPEPAPVAERPVEAVTELPPPPAPAGEPPSFPPLATTRKAAPIIPLVPVPDDPGPDAVAEPESPPKPDRRSESERFGWLYR